MFSTFRGTNSLIGAGVPLSNKQTSGAAGFRCFRKTGRGADDVTDSGRLFHARAAATEKARSPIVERAVSGTISAAVAAESSRRRDLTFATGKGHQLDTVVQVHSDSGTPKPPA